MSSSEVPPPVAGAFAPGEVFAGYRVESVIGRGGMGVVYRATELALQRPVALKVIAPHLVGDREARARFVREARAAASIEHPHVIPVYAADSERAVAFIAMRFVSGHDLRALVRAQGPLPPERAVRLVEQVAEALDAAHRAGFVHRDVKPANVVVGAGDDAYLTDFGLNTALGGNSTASGWREWVGTPDFVAPEQIRGERPDARTDVYALGGLLCFLVTGDAPFPVAGQEAKLWAHLTEPPPSLRHGPAVAFEPVVARAMAKRPERRYASAGDLARAARAALGGGVAAELGPVAAGAAAARDSDTAGAPGLRRRRPRLGPVLVAATTAGLVAGAFILGSRDAPAPGTRDAAASRTPGAAAHAKAPRLVVDARVPAGRRPNSIALAGHRVWVGEREMSRLLIVDARDPRRRSRMAIPSGIAELAANGSDVWVALWAAHALLHIDADRQRRAGRPIPLPGAPSALAVDHGHVWVGLASDRGSPGIVLALDPKSGKTRWTTQLVDQADRLASAHGSLWALLSKPSRLVRLDADTGAVGDTIKLPGTKTGDLATGLGRLWITVQDPDWLIRFDPRTRQRAVVEAGPVPTGLAVHGGAVWVLMYGPSRVALLNPRTLHRRADVEVALNPYMAAADDGGAWVVCLGTGRLVRLHLQGNSDTAG